MLSIKLIDCLFFNSLPNEFFLDWPKLKAFPDKKINVTHKMKYVLGQVENVVGKGEKCWSQAFPPFPTMLSKGFLLRAIKNLIVF